MIFPMLRWSLAIVFTSVGFAGALAAHEATRTAITVDMEGDRILVRRLDHSEPFFAQVAPTDELPHVDLLLAPDGRGVLTAESELHWNLARVARRDLSNDAAKHHWKRVGIAVLKAESDEEDPTVSWRTVYDLFGEDGAVIMRETQTWTIQDRGDHYLIDLTWLGQSDNGVTLGKSAESGLRLQMPPQSARVVKVVNSARQADMRANAQRAVWLNVGLPDADLPGDRHEETTHVAIFDHPANSQFPQAWQVDPQSGIGPATSGLGDVQIQADQPLAVRHRLVVYQGEFNDVWISDRWSEFSGQPFAWAQWNVAQAEGRQAEFLTPEQAVKNMTLAVGFTANVFAAEPLITQPMAFCWDDRGRLWIAENRDYETRQTGFSADGKSRVLILEDHDRDGVADSRKVFLEGIPFPAAIAVGMGGLWLGAPPNLLFVPDANGDDVADMDDIQVRLTGWGILDRHETLNSFVWGPDGWLYGCQGYATPSQVGKPKDGGKLYRGGEPFPEQFQFEGEPTDINGGVWRYHPTKDRFEVVAHGFSNPWGLDYDSRGQLFITACVIPHLWHVIPGGIYHRQGGQHYNKHVYDDIKTIADHRHRSAHGGARVYQSDAFPEQYHGRIFMANIHEHAVLTDILEPRGSGFIGRHGDDFALANNAQWIGFSVEIGPDGNLYVLDWHDADICGKEVLQKETGRVFRFAPTESRGTDFPGRYADLNSLSDLELANLQTVQSVWHASRARGILQHRSGSREIATDAAARLHELLAESNVQMIRLRAMWTLHVTGQLGPARLAAVLGDSDPYVRGWAIQLLCEDGQLDLQTTDRLVAMAASDPSPVVRLYLASAAPRLDSENRWPLLESLAAHGEDADDHNLPKMIWFALEPLVSENPGRSLALAEATEIPLLTRHIARRIGDAELLGPLVSAIDAATDPLVQHNLLLGLAAAVEGRFDMESPAGWGALYPRLRAREGATAKLALQLSQQFGDRVASEAMLTTLLDDNADTQDRLQSMAGLVGRQSDELKPQLLKLFDDDAIRAAAIRAIGAFDDPELSRQLLQRYRDLSESDKLEAIHALASRSSHANQLTDAMQRGEIQPHEVPAYVARILRRVVGNRFTDVWGPIDAGDADSEQQFAKYLAFVNQESLTSADAANGRVVFNRACAACHKLYGYGGNVGPDISGANRSNLEYLLGNILTPSAIIQDAYKMHIVLTDDGRIYSGIPAEENERQLKLRVADRDEPVTIAKSQIESREIAPVSMMPTGILQTLSDREVLDLLKYLQTTTQVPLP
jgi:putative membrane-bound dehydrogenase-like protein